MRIDAYITEYTRKTSQNIALEDSEDSISYNCLEKGISDVVS
jgi:hypothetical protein